MATSTLFRLGDIPASLDDPFLGTHRLPALDHRFDLGRLDEHAAGSERLLAGLENMTSGWKSITSSRKGKEKESVPPVQPSSAGSDERTAIDEMWEEVMVGEAGPSTRPSFVVSRLVHIGLELM